MGDIIEGTVTVTNGRARLPTLEAQKQLQPTGPLEDVVYVELPASQEAGAAAIAQRAAMPPLAFNVIAYVPGPFRIDSKEMHAELKGELEVRGVDGALRIYGHGETTTGRFEVLGRQYEIDHARASFNGSTDPVIDVRLTRAVADTKVIISVHGTASAPQLELASDPPLYNSSQVLGIILSGDPDEQRVDTPSIDRQLAGAISGAVVSKIKGQIVPGLPIDVIKVDTTAGEEGAGRLGGARIEIGHYLRKNIYVSYVHHLGTTMTDLHRTNTHEAKFDYRLGRHFAVGVRYGDASIGAIDVSWTLRY
jgi:translocation and assembly module TamB